MLQITVPISPEGWDEERQEFVDPQVKTLQLEHSLVSISKWESKWHKAFLSKKDKTEEEIFDYIKCMTLTQNVDPSVYDHLTVDNVNQIKAYIEDPMTATVINTNSSDKSNKETVTSELIYYWMIALNIPSEYQKWHINRLLKLIEVCNVKNSPPKKRSKSDIMRSNAALNAARRKQLGTRG
jgi:hypothetical protein